MGQLQVNGDVSMNSNVSVGGTITGDLSQNFIAGNNITLTQTNDNVITIASSGGSFDGEGDVSFNENVDISGQLQVYGDVSMNSNVSVGGTIIGDISPNLTAGTGISLSTTTGVTTINNTATGTSIQYGWRASSTTTGTASLSAGTRINYNSITNNTTRDFETPSGAGNYKTGNQEYEVAVAGYYLIGFNILVNTGSTDCEVNLKKTTSGGTTSALAQSGKQNKSTEDCITTSYLDVGDKVFVEVVSGTILLDYNTAGTYFYGFLQSGSSQLSTSTQYYFKANGTADQGITTGTTNQLLDFNNVLFQNPTGYDTGTKEYVVQVAGVYQFFYQLFFLYNNANAEIRLGIYLTRAGTTPGYINQTGQYIFTSERMGLTYECLVGDRLSVRVVYNGSGATRNISLTESIFEGYLLQPENNTITDTTDLTTNSLTTSTTNVSNSNISNLTIDNNLNGYAFIRTICIAKVLANGTNVKTIGCTISRSNNLPGRYACVLDVARPSSDYCVQLTVMEDSEDLDDVIISLTQGSMSTTGFLYVIHEQDNGDSPGAYRDRNHFVTVFDTD